MKKKLYWFFYKNPSSYRRRGKPGRQ